MPSKSLNPLRVLLLLVPLLSVAGVGGRRSPSRWSRNSTASHGAVSSASVGDDSLVYVWPLPKESWHGDGILSVDPGLALVLQLPLQDSTSSSNSQSIVVEAFGRYKDLIFKSWSRSSAAATASYNVSKLTVVVTSDDDSLQFGVDESYTLYVGGGDALSVVGGATVEANTIYGALRGLETFSQLCVFDYDTKTVEVHKAPWYITDEPRFPYRGLLLDTSRHYLPVNVIKSVIDSMSYAKLNVLHWHIIDEQSFPLEVPSYPDLWKGSYTNLERYTIEDAYDIVDFAKRRGIHIMAEIDVPGHAESWGAGYPELWPSLDCTEPLDVSKNLTFEVLSGILGGQFTFYLLRMQHFPFNNLLMN